MSCEKANEKVFKRLNEKLPQLTEVKLAYVEGWIDAYLLDPHLSKNKKSAS